MIGLRSRARAAFGWPARRALWGVVLLLVALVDAAPALADRAMSTRFSTNDTGNITFAANTLMVCPATTPPQPAPRCTTARNTPAVASGSNAGLNNNGYLMQYVNTAAGVIPVLGQSFDSSSSTLSLPSTATVLFAGLYWGATRTQARVRTASGRRAQRSGTRWVFGPRGQATRGSPRRKWTPRHLVRRAATARLPTSRRPCRRPARAFTASRTCRRATAATVMPAGRWWSPMRIRRSRLAT